VVVFSQEPPKVKPDEGIIVDQPPGGTEDVVVYPPETTDVVDKEVTMNKPDERATSFFAQPGILAGENHTKAAFQLVHDNSVSCDCDFLIVETRLFGDFCF